MYKTFNPSLLLKSEDITIAEATIQACYNCKFEIHTMSRQKMFPNDIDNIPDFHDLVNYNELRLLNDKI